MASTLVWKAFRNLDMAGSIGFNAEAMRLDITRIHPDGPKGTDRRIEPACGNGSIQKRIIVSSTCTATRLLKFCNQIWWLRNETNTQPSHAIENIETSSLMRIVQTKLEFTWRTERSNYTWGPRGLTRGQTNMHCIHPPCAYLGPKTWTQE